MRKTYSDRRETLLLGAYQSLRHNSCSVRHTWLPSRHQYTRVCVAVIVCWKHRKWNGCRFHPTYLQQRHQFRGPEEMLRLLLHYTMSFSESRDILDVRRNSHRAILSPSISSSAPTIAIIWTALIVFKICGSWPGCAPNPPTVLLNQKCPPMPEMAMLRP